MVQGGTSRDLTLDGVHLVIQLDPMHLKQPCHDVLKERKHEHSPRRVRISKVQPKGFLSRNYVAQRSPPPTTGTSIIRTDRLFYPSDDVTSSSHAINLPCQEQTPKRSTAPRESLQAALDPLQSSS
ncbi:hypothetical protein TNCV_4664881 [Trichonephila clavipes]|uniref:Uncharacterized protein n=1 Tax=Trichonephila clavipes TaxID=2585209 RepID=A0A8X6RTE2_TRICX|nr:hypothetical protein TNCV_4664881 [Trichonephila clavipes]